MEILLYKPIVLGSAELFNLEIKKNTPLRVRMHCIGGNVYEGIAISNAVTQSKDSRCIIEGVAASIGAVIACSFKKTLIRKSARMMIHEITTEPVGGNANTLRENANDIDKNNLIIANIIAKKVNKTAEWVKENWMKPYINKWFSAEEALAAGLVDEIIDDEAALTNQFGYLPSYENDEVINIFNSFFKPVVKSSINMEQLNGLLACANIKNFNGTQEQAIALLSAKLTNQATRIQQLEAENKAFKYGKLNALMDEKKVPTKSRQLYIDVADKVGMDAATELVNNLQSVSVTLTPAKDEMTYKEWCQKDPAGLMNIMKTDPERYGRILKTYK